MTNFTTFPSLSYSDLKELQSYLRKHIDDCISHGIGFPESLYVVAACVKTDIILVEADIEYTKSLESKEH